jgi:hypothetical protein
MRRCLVAIAVLVIGCSAPTDERATLDGSVAHPRCESCHVAEFEAAERPPHSGELPATCFVCHVQEHWSPAVLQHDFYPLTGAHLDARCFGCHRIGSDDNEPTFEGTPGECVHCHRDDYDRSTFPGHQRFALTCADCHSTAQWAPTLHPPPPPEPDAGVDAGSWLDGIGSASLGGHGESILVDPSTAIGLGGLDAGLDAGHHRRPPHRPPHTGTTPPSTDTPPPTTVIEEPPPTEIDIGTSASRRGR